MNNEYLDHVIVMLQQAEVKVKDNFTMLSEPQLNWKPNEKKWSIAECLDHLIVTNNLYLKIFEKIKADQIESNFWTKVPFWHKLGGNLVLKSVDPDNAKKVKTFGIFKPRYSAYSNDIICDFEDVQAKLISDIKALDRFNHKKVKIISPVNKAVVYTLYDACNILWKHEIRHFNQAKNLMELEGFPKS